MVVAFLFGSRERYIYYVSVYMFDKLYIGYLKLAYHEPRPYMAEGNIHPLSCSKAFGTPSGHSSASVTFAIVLFLDVMHGQNPLVEKRFDDKGKFVIDQSSIAAAFNKSNWMKKSLPYAFFGWVSWLMLAVLCLGWATCIPFSRWILGVHGLDQIIFGIQLGLWTGLTSHFFVRDNLFRFAKKIRMKGDIWTKQEW